ncbi:MAG: glycosyltransferase family 4 protein [Chitinophagaceae bacterium]
MKKKLNIHIFFSTIENESRLMKETGSLVSLNLVDEILIIGKGEDFLKRSEKVDEKREILRLSLLKQNGAISSPIRRVKGLIRIFQFNFKVLYLIIKKRPAFISCHNLMLLPIASIAKFFSRAKLIYTPHELETERTGLTTLNKKLSKLSESFFIRFANKVLVVCDPIKDWYFKIYNLKNIFVLPNLPYNPFINTTLYRTNWLRKEFNIPDEHYLFIYQGVIDKARGCADLIENFKNAKTDRHLIFMGYGSMVEELKQMTLHCKNIHYKPAVAVNQIINFTSSADIGIFYIPTEITLSYKFSLPNKFFEYLMAGLPVIVSENLEYLSQKIYANKLGWVLSSEKKDFIERINSITKKEIQEIQEHVLPYAKQNGWQFEEKILNEVYS